MIGGKIGIFGAHSIGKSTLCKYLSFRSGQISQNSDEMIEVVRILENMGFVYNKDTTFDSQEAVQYEQRVQELRIERRLKAGIIKLGILDRTVIDNYVYAENKFPEQSEQRLYRPMMEWLEHHPYDALFRVPLWNKDQPIVDDSFREKDKPFQIAIEERLERTLIKIGISYHTVPAKIFMLNEDAQAIALRLYFDEHLGLSELKGKNSKIITPWSDPAMEKGIDQSVTSIARFLKDL